jgi:hypothetical protein
VLDRRVELTQSKWTYKISKLYESTERSINKFNLTENEWGNGIKQILKWQEICLRPNKTLRKLSNTIGNKYIKTKHLLIEFEVGSETRHLLHISAYFSLTCRGTPSNSHCRIWTLSGGSVHLCRALDNWHQPRTRLILLLWFDEQDFYFGEVNEWRVKGKNVVEWDGMAEECQLEQTDRKWIISSSLLICSDIKVRISFESSYQSDWFWFWFCVVSLLKQEEPIIRIRRESES